MRADRRRRGRVIRRTRRRADRAITYNRRASTVSVELYPETAAVEREIRKAAEQLSACSGIAFEDLAQFLRIFTSAVTEHAAPHPRQLLHNGRKP